MKKWMSLALVLMLAVGILAGCGQKEETKTNDTKQEMDKENSQAENKDKDAKADQTDTKTTSEPSKLPNDKVVLTVGDYQMTKAEANIYVYTTKMNVERLGGATIWVNEIQEGKTFEALQLERLKDTLAYVAILNEEAKKRGLALTEEEKTEAFADIDAILESLPQALKDYYGFSKEVFERFLQSQALGSKVMQDEMKDFVVDQAALKEKYEADSTYQRLEAAGENHYYDKVRARHILISTLDADRQPLPEDKKAEAKKKAEDILAKAKAGEDFAELAKTYSEDPGSKDNGGEYIFGRGEMVKEFEDAAFALKPGEISGLVETTYGYHIIKLEEKTDSTPEQVKQAQELRQQIISRYEDELKMEEFQKRYEEIKKNYNVEFDEAVFADLSLSYTVPAE